MDASVGKPIIILSVIAGLIIIAGLVFFYFGGVKDNDRLISPEPVNEELSGQPLEETPPVVVEEEVSDKKSPVGLTPKFFSVPPTAPFVQVVYPNGGERLCLGRTVTVRWKSLGIKSIGVFLRDTRDTKLDSDYPLGIYRADPSGTGTEGVGSFEWKVGNTTGGVVPPEAAAYKLLIKGTVGDQFFSDLSDKLFSIAKCN